MDGPFTLEGNTLRVDHALTQPRPLPGGNPGDDAHNYVVESVAKHRDRLIGCAIINPMQDLERSLDALEDLVKNKGFRALKLHPAVHRYRPDEKSVRTRILSKVFEKTLQLGIPILIHTGDPLTAEPSRMAPIIEDFPEQPVILCHLGTQNISYSTDAVYVAQKNPNVWVESEPAFHPRLKEAVEALGANRIVYATDCPALDMWASVTRLYSLKTAPPLGVSLSQGEVDQILGLNMARLLGLKP